MITDVLFTSPILHGEDAGGAGGHVPADGSAGMVVDGPGGPVAGGGQFAEFGGINPDMDPELAMALKVSMEEERARQGAGEEEAKPAEEKPATDAPQAEPANAPAQEAPAEEEEHDEQYYLDQAIKLSMQEEEQPKKEEAKPKEE